MATTKPRFTITLEPRTYAALTALCEASGVSKSGFIERVLSSNVGTFERLGQILEAARSADDAAVQAVNDHLRELLEFGQYALAEVQEAAENAAARAQREVVCPPISNRGGQNRSQQPQPAGVKGENLSATKVLRMRDHRRAR